MHGPTIYCRLPRSDRRAWRIVALVAGLSATSSVSISAAAAAQGSARAPAQAQVGAQSEMESYLRALQLTGASRSETPWSVRPFGPVQLDAALPTTRTHPWATRFDFNPRTPGSGITVLPVEVEAIGNSAFPYGMNDGPLWAGRGVTAAASGGILMHVGRTLTIRLDPTVFWAQNASFPLRPNGQTGRLRFADATFPDRVDNPQRFGNSSYAVADPGDSYVRLDTRGVAVGFSTANEWWGPTTRYPYILGTNAAGIPHVFIGTSAPIGPHFLRVHGRVIYGIESQSQYSPVTGSTRFQSVDEPGTHRFASGVVLAAQPGGLPGFELGAGRFFHSAIPATGLESSLFRKPFQGIFKAGLPTQSGFLDSQGGGDNQEFSLFFRWAHTHSGVEVYGEYGREDHNYDLRDALEEPDHARVFSLGMQKVLHADAQRMSLLRAELIDGEPTSTARHRDEGLIYIHAPLRQGHTQRGQLLGTGIGVGTFAGATLSLERYTPSGMWTYRYERTVSRNGTYPIVAPLSPRNSVMHALTVERMRFVPGGELRVGVTAADDLDHVPGQDRVNLNGFVRYALQP